MFIWFLLNVGDRSNQKVSCFVPSMWFMSKGNMWVSLSSIAQIVKIVMLTMRFSSKACLLRLSAAVFSSPGICSRFTPKIVLKLNQSSLDTSVRPLGRVEGEVLMIGVHCDVATMNDFLEVFASLKNYQQFLICDSELQLHIIEFP
jgi:hypothetical protein